jgi:hypothetical protein
VIAHNLIALLSAVVADVNHCRLREQLEQSPEPPSRPAAARVAAHNTKLVRRWLPAVPGRVLHSGRRVVLRLAEGMHWAATFIAAYQRLRRLAPIFAQVNRPQFRGAGRRACDRSTRGR